jgi:hypothetical protein
MENEVVLDQRVCFPIPLAEEILRWLEVLADTNDSQQLTATIEALAIRLEGRYRLELIMSCPNPMSSSP